MLYNVTSALLRAVGDSKTPLMLLLLSSVLNIGLDLLFILAFGWDVAGAAIATVIHKVSQLCFVLFILSLKCLSLFLIKKVSKE